MVGIAEEMVTAVEGEIGVPMVMDCISAEGWQDADLLHRLLAAFGMQGEEG